MLVWPEQRARFPLEKSLATSGWALAEGLSVKPEQLEQVTYIHFQRQTHRVMHSEKICRHVNDRAYFSKNLKLSQCKYLIIWHIWQHKTRLQSATERLTSAHFTSLIFHLCPSLSRILSTPRGAKQDLNVRILSFYFFTPFTSPLSLSWYQHMNEWHFTWVLPCFLSSISTSL